MEISKTYLRRRVRRRVRALKGFYIHLLAYSLVNGYLIISGLFEQPVDLSGLWVASGWGIGIAAHAFSVFGTPFLSRWEERKTEELLDRERKKKQGRG